MQGLRRNLNKPLGAFQDMTMPNHATGLCASDIAENNATHQEAINVELEMLAIAESPVSTFDQDRDLATMAQVHGSQVSFATDLDGHSPKELDSVLDSIDFQWTHHSSNKRLLGTVLLRSAQTLSKGKTLYMKRVLGFCKPLVDDNDLFKVDFPIPDTDLSLERAYLQAPIIKY
ncbi:hypothetical protein BG004_007402 [Podila humilis]|nr:hypothetical protein BG004_007402 [Podila humilis]